jgi:hypothetical protein
MSHDTHVWTRIRDSLRPSGPQRLHADQLHDTFRTKGTLRTTCADLLRLPLPTIAHFYARLIAEDGPPCSPVASQPDASWMTRTDFCFVNIRATGIDDTAGGFLQAAKLLPGLRAAAIHLAPFTLYDFDVIYAVSSVRTLAPQLVDNALVAAGISPEDQLQALVDAAHLLGQAVGFDVEPHVNQFAIPVLEHPEAFRWIKLYAPDKRWLDYLQTNDDMLQQHNQSNIVGVVRGMVQSALRSAGLTTLEREPGDTETVDIAKSTIYHALVSTLIQQGFWTVQCNTWSGVGIPAFKGYHHKGYPEFRNVTREGIETGDRTFGVVTPFAFYHDIPTSQPPAARPAQNTAAVDYFTGIFPYWRDTFGFDFVRYDSVDHVFDSVENDDPDHPAADRPTPSVLQQAIAASRTPDAPYVGNLAERMGTEAAQYASVGFDAMLGNDMWETVGVEHMEKCFRLYDELCELNRGAARSFAVAYAVDTHDTGDLHLLGEPLLKKLGSKGTLLRQFIARFLNVGCAPRPKYEVMGAQDMSYGLYEANMHPVPLHWTGDRAHNTAYHNLEDLYAHLRPFLQRGEIVDRHIDTAGAWWVIQSGAAVIVPVVAWEPWTVTLDVGRWLGVKDRWHTALYDPTQPPSAAGKVPAQPTLEFSMMPAMRVWALNTGNR